MEKITNEQEYEKIMTEIFNLYSELNNRDDYIEELENKVSKIYDYRKLKHVYTDPKGAKLNALLDSLTEWIGFSSIVGLMSTCFLKAPENNLYNAILISNLAFLPLPFALYHKKQKNNKKIRDNYNKEEIDSYLDSADAIFKEYYKLNGKTYVDDTINKMDYLNSLVKEYRSNNKKYIKRYLDENGNEKRRTYIDSKVYFKKES